MSDEQIAGLRRELQEALALVAKLHRSNGEMIDSIRVAAASYFSLDARVAALEAERDGGAE